MEKARCEPDLRDLLQSGVPLAESLPEDVFLAIQAGRLEAAAGALGMLACALDTHGPLASYLTGLKKLIGAVRDDLEVLKKSKTPS